MRRLILRGINFYRQLISPWVPPSCRFVPSCSLYAFEAIDKYGVVRGVWFALRRVSRCHPFVAGGYDPLR